MSQSLCFQVPAVAEEHGLTIVVTPLLCLCSLPDLFSSPLVAHFRNISSYGEPSAQPDKAKYTSRNAHVAV